MDERRVLAEIEQEFLRDEPLLAHRLATFEWPGPLSRRRLAGIAAAVLALVLIASAFAGDGTDTRCSPPSSYGAWANGAGRVPADADADTADGTAPDTAESVSGVANDRAHTSDRGPTMWQFARCAQADRSPLAALVAGGGFAVPTHGFAAEAA